MQPKKAYDFYKKHILDENKEALFREYGFSYLVSSQDWELFAAILLNKKKKKLGVDLQGHEIKSAKSGYNFEYQYHKNTGLDKLKEDQKASHVFITYSPDYKNVTVRKIRADGLAQKFLDWEKDLTENYKLGKQRFRRSITHKHVRQKSEVILQIQDTRIKK
tara:strand:+ start:564 stop:1049 length:486 start_codon:yes stop_codon:yes gene_type:complete